MTNYYFLTSMLPPIEVGHTPALPFEELKTTLAERLTAQDFEQFRMMRLFIDLENLRSFLKGGILDPRGNYSNEDFEEVLSFRIGFPDFVFDFLDRYDSLEDRLRHFSWLFSQFFDEVIGQEEGFLKQYLLFEREWRIVMLGFRAKKMGRDVSKELQYEDSHDLLVAQVLAQKDAKSYEPPFGYGDLKVLFENKNHDPMALHRALCEYRFNKIMELEEGHLFAVDRVLGYTARLMIVEKWLELDQEAGKELVEGILSQ